MALDKSILLAFVDLFSCDFYEAYHFVLLGILWYEKELGENFFVSEEGKKPFISFNGLGKVNETNSDMKNIMLQYN